MRWATAILTLCLWATPGWGAPILVRSGDHDGFTRLVFPLPPDQDWALTRTDQHAQVTITPNPPQFDLSDVYRRIDQRRLARISEDGGLHLGLGCACTVTAFRHQDRYLVIDIQDPPAGDLSARFTPVDPFRWTSDPNPGSTATTEIVREQTPEVTWPAPELHPGTGSQATQTSAQTPEMTAASSLLSDEIAAAAAIGLLDPQPRDPMADLGPERGEPHRRPDQALGSESASEGPGAVVPITAGSGLGLDARNAVTLARARPESSGSTRDPRCLPEEAFDLRPWVSGDGFEQEIGRHRARLFDARGDLDPDAALDLVRHYLYHGFGHEAAFWLRFHPAPPTIERALSLTLQGTETPAFGAPPSVPCSGPETLWRYIADGTALPPGADHRRAMMRAFAALPATLRDMLGADLAAALQTDGWAAEAQEVRDLLTRGARLPDSAAQMVALQADPGSDLGRTQDRLGAVMQTDRSRTGDAMHQLLRITREANALPAPDQLSAARAILREIGPHGQADGLWHEVILALTGYGALDEALHLLGEAAGPDVAQAVLTDMFAVALARDDLASLVILTVSQAATWPSTADTTALRRDLAARFTAAALPELALRVAPPGTPFPPPSTADAATLRDAWQRGDWAALRRDDAGPYNAFAERVLDGQTGRLPAATDPNGLPTLAALIDDSAATRAAIEQALRASPPNGLVNTSP